MTSKFKVLKQISSFLEVMNPGDLSDLEGSLTPILLCWYAANGEYH
jgi:hypothetical protein